MKYTFRNFINGEFTDSGLERTAVESLDGEVTIEVPDSGLAELLLLRDSFIGVDNDLRWRNSRRSVDERIEIVRALYRGLSSRRDELIDVVHRVHGTPKNYLGDSLEGLGNWVGDLEDFLTEVDKFSKGRDGIALADREVISPYGMVTAGNFEAYEQLYAIGQSILSGTHTIVRPSAQDIGTHILFEVMEELGIRDVASKITWSSQTQPEMIKALLRFVHGASIFGSDEMIDRMTRTVVEVEYPDGKREERVLEDLTEGRKFMSYGSGNSMMVVMDFPKEAAEHFYYAKVYAKGNKCWVPDGAFVYGGHKEAFYRRLQELDRENTGNRPRFRGSEVKAIGEFLDRVIPGGYDRYEVSDSDELGIIICPNTHAAYNLYADELTIPVGGIISVESMDDVLRGFEHITRNRGAEDYLSIGFFGSQTDFDRLKVAVPSEAYHFNESLKVDLMEAHQGSYFILDPSK